jgi:hypothetical protein
MPIGLVAFFIGIFLIVWNVLIWKKLRVVDAQLALMQNELKELRIIEARLFHMMLNAPASLKKTPDTELNTSASAAPETQDADGQAAPAALTQTTKKGVMRVAAPSK